jgi:outer membrane autotransporter protein
MKVFSEAYLSGLPLLNQTGDLAIRGLQDFLYDFHAFGIFAGGQNRYYSGSHIDLKSYSVVGGVGKGFALPAGELSVAAFVEYGKGNYDTYNIFTTALHGTGDLKHFGAGVLGKYNFGKLQTSGFYVEGSLRAGRIRNEYRNGDLRYMGVAGGYNASNAYMGLHLGAGYVWELTDNLSLDISGKYFRAVEKGDSIHLTTGDPIHFDDVTSSRIRLGGRLVYEGLESVKPYAALYYEREGDGKVSATTSGYKIETPDLSGTTGIGEIGVTFIPAPQFTIEAGLQGYAGRREGFTGSLRIKYAF